MTQAPPLPAAVDSIHRSLSELCSTSPDQESFENSKQFTGYAHRLQLVFSQLLRSSASVEELPASVETGLRGISGDLSNAAETVSVYRKRSKIFVLVNCQSLSASLLERTVAIGTWLELIESSLLDDFLSDLRKKTSDLSRDMKQAKFRVTENEERVRRTLEKEGQGRVSSKAVQSAIIMDLARALGIDASNHQELSEQVKLFKTDVARSSSVAERRIMISLEKILDNWSSDPDVEALNVDLNSEDEAHLSPFKNFLCPLTKEVMKEPVVVSESSQNYDKKAILYWFSRCVEDGRDPTCPVTGMVLTTMELKPNLGLAGAIDEWICRNVEVRVNSAVEHISKDPFVKESIERALDSIYRISEEHSSYRYKVRNAGLVVLIVNLLRKSSKDLGSRLRGKALLALLSMAKDEESKKIMLEEGVTRLAVHSLVGSSDKEREYSVKLLLEFSNDEDYCIKVTSEKGALVLLSSMAGNLENPALSNLADELLKRMESMEENIQVLAAAGRFKPLLTRLREGSDDDKIEMASILGRMTLTNSSKEEIARTSAKILVELLSNPEARVPSLKALCNLSSLDDNATILVDANALPALTGIILENETAVSPELVELATSAIANIVSNPGHWELTAVDKSGNTMQSASIVSSLLQLLSVASSLAQASILQILYGIASSPRTAESVASRIKSSDGIKTVISYLEHPEVGHRINAYRLTRLLSERFAQALLYELQTCNKNSLLKDKLLDDQSTDAERSDAACILANLPFSGDELKTLLDAGFVRWIVSTLKTRNRNTNGKSSRSSSSSSSSLTEGLLGILLHFTKKDDQTVLTLVRELRLMTLLREELGFPSKPRIKELAALGLRNLSEAATIQDPDPPSPPSQGFCVPIIFICGRVPPKPATCPIHNNISCDNNGYDQLCLLSNDCIKPLIDLLSDDNTNVQISAVEALSTLIPKADSSDITKRGMNEFEELRVVDSVIDLFMNVRPGELQEKTLWMVDKFLRAEGCSHRHSLNQSLVGALVEALKHGNGNTKRYAQDALTNLKQLSGVSGTGSGQVPSQR
ncbi:U-box domain-containing protein 43 [Linum grandiflorum]